MKNSRHSLVIEEPPLSSMPCSSCNPPSLNIQSICQRHIEQLVVQLPLVAALVVYYDLNQGKRQSVVHFTQKETFSSPELFALESEVWLANSLPALTLSEVGILDNFRAFVCLFDENSSQAEYLLLCTYEPLSTVQQQWVEQQVQLLISYIAVCRECTRQHLEIELLEQVIRRTEHQLRNPLALISLYAEKLYLEAPVGCLKEEAQLIRETVNDVSTNLTDLLYCGQQAKLQIAPHDLRTIVAESIKGLQPWIEQKQLRVGYLSTPAVLAIDRWQIKQVFDNLLSNAVHFSPEAGTVVCHWQVFRHEVLVEVCDQGPGLSEDDLKQVFTPFYSKRPGGTGLGLAIAKKIILDHHGSLWVQNLPRGGAQFSFTLPRV